MRMETCGEADHDDAMGDGLVGANGDLFTFAFAPSR